MVEDATLAIGSTICIVLAIEICMNIGWRTIQSAYTANGNCAAFSSSFKGIYIGDFFDIPQHIFWIGNLVPKSLRMTSTARCLASGDDIEAPKRLRRRVAALHSFCMYLWTSYSNYAFAGVVRRQAVLHHHIPCIFRNCICTVPPPTISPTCPI